jgi:hypothetical protein
LTGSVDPDALKTSGDGTVDVAREAVADHHRLLGIGSEQREGVFEDRGVGLGDTELGGDDNGISVIWMMSLVIPLACIEA